LEQPSTEIRFGEGTFFPSGEGGPTKRGGKYNSNMSIFNAKIKQEHQVKSVKLERRKKQGMGVGTESVK